MDISYSYTVTPQENKPATSTPAKAWIFVPHTFSPVPPNNILIRSKIDDANTIITADVYAAMEHCQSFRSMEGHALEIGKKIPALNGHQKEVMGILEQISKTGLFIEKEAYFQSLNTAAGNIEPESVIARIFIRTCDRPTAIERLIGSMNDAGISSDTNLNIVIIDDSRSEENQQLNSQLVIQADNKQSAQFEYFGPQQQKQFKTALAAALPAHQDSIEFLLSAPADITDETPGIPLNYALLLSAGHKMAMLDDDSICVTYQPMISTEGVQINSKGRQGCLVNNDSSWQQSSPIKAAELLDEFSQSLGTPLQQMITRHHIDSSSLDDLSLADVEYVNSGSRVLVTGCGTVGDPGTGSNAWVFHQGVEYLNGLAETEADYETLIQNRNAWLGVTSLSLQSDYSLMTTTMTGLDNRALLPPTMPCFRNEDMMLGTLMNAIHPDSLKLDYPVSLAHLPQPRRHWKTKSTTSAYTLSVGAFLPDYIQQRIKNTGSSTAENRLQYFAGILKDLGNADHAFIKREAMNHLTRLRGDGASKYMNMLKTSAVIKPWVKKDLQQAIQEDLQAIQSQTTVEFSELKNLGSSTAQLEFFSTFSAQLGAALACWPAMRDAARTLRNANEKQDDS